MWFSTPETFTSAQWPATSMVLSTPLMLTVP